jgi:hypothetical protein
VIIARYIFIGTSVLGNNKLTFIFSHSKLNKILQGFERTFFVFIGAYARCQITLFKKKFSCTFHQEQVLGMPCS